DVADFAALGGEDALSPDDRATLARARSSPRVEHRDIRRLKLAPLRAAFERFVDAERRRDTERSRALRSYVSEQAWWIEDYALFRALHAREGERPWTEWSLDLERRETAAQRA